MFAVPLRPADAIALASLGKHFFPAADDKTTKVSAQSAHHIRHRWLVFGRS
jgi:hypothetical protein